MGKKEIISSNYLNMYLEQKSKVMILEKQLEFYQETLKQVNKCYDELEQLKKSVNK